MSGRSWLSEKSTRFPSLHASRGLQMTHRFKQQEMKIQAWENHEKRRSGLDMKIGNLRQLMLFNLEMLDISNV
ncbi:hypothetical protein CTI12_AA369800 [Artemisia annua]|uniref:Remorin C-terminal domain-containing protein n=1 Tax=Artemisia annua TaxID=35608 RepID=A0A2U1MEB4_ARTAN|nr:hypothetical protein CTI12_AA369800 [Artemisia annua]